jgi:hypothetical protein
LFGAPKEKAGAEQDALEPLPPPPAGAQLQAVEATSGLKTGVIPSPDTKKSMNRGWSAADVDKGKSLKKNDYRRILANQNM